jgi:RNA polymerase primary sigma factor
MTKKNKKNYGLDTGSEGNALHYYFREISRLPLLSREEEEKCAMLAAQGNKAAREKLINGNLRFVISIAKKYQGKGLPFEDLISEGNIGLMSAIEHYDVEKGCRFITYAVWWIRQAITKAMQEKVRMIRLPLNKVNELNMITQARQVMQSDEGREDDMEIREAAMYLKMAPEKAVDLMSISQEVVSLDTPIVHDESTYSMQDFIEDECSQSPEQEAVNSLLRKDLNKVVDGLEKKAAKVIRYRYGLGDSAPMTLKEVSDHCNFSKERARQIERRALIKLQRSPDCEKLSAYIAS